MKKLHFIAHTHWDREWYQPFRKFQLRLVHLIDSLLDILDDDPTYRHFMLDGQTIVLEDYLEYRPENRQKIIDHVKSGRIGIGPWYVLSDEFLVSPEATIRNLLIGKRICELFGKRMMVGYIPDPFGHIAQMPQILKGFGIPYASYRRGLADEPTELYWQSPDGSTVLLSYERDGYDNANNLSDYSAELWEKGAESVAQSLESFSQSDLLLMMYGTDHQEPRRITSEFIQNANNSATEYTFLHSSLPDYFADLEKDLNESGKKLTTHIGEARQSKRHELLPGVLSSRAEIKRANHDCEWLMEKWVEPFCAWSAFLSQSLEPQDTKLLNSVQPLIQETWKLLLQCHPHDSICGCSIDEVHHEMYCRFEQVKQVGEELTYQSLVKIAQETGTLEAVEDGQGRALLVFNSSPFKQTGLVNFEFLLPAGWQDVQILDASGKPIVLIREISEGEEFANMPMDKESLQGMLDVIQDGRVSGMGIQDIEISQNENIVSIEIVLSRIDPPRMEIFKQAMERFEELMADEKISIFQIHARGPQSVHGHLLAKDVSACGFRAFGLRPTKSEMLAAAKFDEKKPEFIQNEFFKITMDENRKSFSIMDQRDGTTYSGLNRFVDGGEVGDSYNHNEPEKDGFFEGEIKQIDVLQDEFGESYILDYEINIPEGLNPNRDARSESFVICPIQTTVTLQKGIPRIDVTTKVQNHAKDHRLKVHFPSGIVADGADVDSHFEVIHRKAEIPNWHEDYREQTYPEFPQRLFTDVSNGNRGLMVANKGLYECQAIPLRNGTVEIALTLLRCVGWLSQKNLPRRPRDAGPYIETPEGQQLGEHVFEYSIIPHEGNWNIAKALAYGFNLPMRSMATSCHEGTLPLNCSMVETSTDDFMISAVKRSEDGKSLLIRGYNPGGKDIIGKLKTWKTPLSVSTSTLDEKEEHTVPLDDDGSFQFIAKSYQVLSFSLKF
jgi:alpha-mannosidase